jgi:hypothetical protein
MLPTASMAMPSGCVAVKIHERALISAPVGVMSNSEMWSCVVLAMTMRCSSGISTRPLGRPSGITRNSAVTVTTPLTSRPL